MQSDICCVLNLITVVLYVSVVLQTNETRKSQDGTSVYKTERFCSRMFSC